MKLFSVFLLITSCYVFLVVLVGQISNKLQPRSVQCVFLGYSLWHKGYKCFHSSSGRTYISHDVIFDELSFPFNSKLTSCTHSPSNTDSILYQPLPHLSKLNFTSPQMDPPNMAHTSLTNPNSSPLVQSHVPSSSHEIFAVPLSSFVEPITDSPNSSSVASSFHNHHMVTRSKNSISKPKVFNDGTTRYPLPRALLAKSISFVADSTCFTQAIKDSKWRHAMNLEFDALLKNQTWKLVPPVKAKNVVGCKWVFRIKRKADGSIDWYKARLVANGFH